MFKKSRAIFMVVVILSLVFVFVACGKKEETPQNVEQNTTPVTLKLFYPYDTGTDVAINEVTVTETLTENESKLEKINHYLQNPVPQEGITPIPVLKGEAKIISVDQLENNIAKVNVNREFISQMNAGASFEGGVIKSLAKTIIHSYNVDGIILLVEGQPYESGHFAFGPNEVIRDN